MGRIATSLFVVAVVSAACSDDAATPAPTPSTVEAAPEPTGAPTVPPEPPATATATTTATTAGTPSHPGDPDIGVDMPDRDEWRIASDGIARFTDVLAEPTDDPDAFPAVFGYGGADWSGRLEIERFWTQADYTVGDTTVRATLDVDSRSTPDGQWLTTDLIDWEADGPPFGETTVDDRARSVLPPPFALLVAPDGRIGNAYLRASDELASRNQRIWFGQLLLEALPSFPEDELGPGARWQSRVQGDQDGTGPVYTVIEVDGDELHLEVAGSFGAYFGDRYDGYLVDAEIAGTIVLHRAAAIPLAVDIEKTGTITYGVGGEPDLSTAEPWRSTLVIRAIEAAE